MKNVEKLFSRKANEALKKGIQEIGTQVVQEFNLDEAERATTKKLTSAIHAFKKKLDAENAEGQ